MIDPLTLAHTLRQARARLDISLRALSRRSGVSLSLLSRLESGESANPTLHVIRALTVALRLDPLAWFAVVLPAEESETNQTGKQS